MPYLKTAQLPGEPIFIVLFDGVITPEDTLQSYLETAHLWYDDLRKTGSHIIIDARTAEGNFIDTMGALRQSVMQEQQLAEMMQHVQFYIVGTNALIKLYTHARQQQQFGGLNIPLFAGIEDALAAARTAIAQKQHTSTPS
ncbi:MAG: hypothetical protein SF162_11635 [bacterium]|nr:hypothetical protein [bacterium]